MSFEEIATTEELQHSPTQCRVCGHPALTLRPDLNVVCEGCGYLHGKATRHAVGCYSLPAAVAPIETEPTQQPQPKLREERPPYMDFGLDERCRAARFIIRMQYPDTADAAHALGVVESALNDLCSTAPPKKKEKKERWAAWYNEWERDRASAVQYLGGEMYLSECLGINSTWIHRVLKQVGIFLDNPNTNYMTEQEKK